MRHPDSRNGLVLYVSRVRRRSLSSLEQRPVLLWTLGVVAIAAIGVFDYASGTELRIYPLYFGPVALLAWYAGLRGCVVAAMLSAAPAWRPPRTLRRAR